MPATISSYGSKRVITGGSSKSPLSATHNRYGLGLDHKAALSNATRIRPESAIRSLFPVENEPGMLSLLAGKPNASTFPISNISMSIKPVEGSDEEVNVDIKGADLDAALQYGQTSGLPKLVEWLTQWGARIHDRDSIRSSLEAKEGQNSWRVTVGNGSQDLLTKTFNALLNPGDTILVESPVYTGILPVLITLKANIVSVETDSEGLMSTSLENILSQWHVNPETASQPYPKVIYTVPTAANPSGTTASEERKKEVLSVARQYGVLIMEDDPYMLLSFAGLGEATPETRPRTRTYFSLEQDDAKEWGTGWVIRFDSFSKIIGGGFRVGWMTGPKVIVDAVDEETSSANLQASGVAQAIVLALLEKWDHGGLLCHCDRVASFYRQRRDNYEMKARAILGPQIDGRKAVAEWITPTAGMFLWLKLILPPVNIPGGQDGNSFDLISIKARKKRVLAVPGVAFVPNEACSCYVRTSYSIIREEDVEEAFKRLREAVEETWQEMRK